MTGVGLGAPLNNTWCNSSRRRRRRPPLLFGRSSSLSLLRLPLPLPVLLLLLVLLPDRTVLSSSSPSSSTSTGTVGTSATAASARSVEIIFDRNSVQYGRVQVFSATAAGVPARFLVTDGAIIGARFTDAEYEDQAVFTIFALLQAAGQFLVPVPQRGLVLGLGAGAANEAWRAAGMRVVDTIELIPDVVTAAEEYFGFVRGGSGGIGGGSSSVGDDNNEGNPSPNYEGSSSSSSPRARTGDITVVGDALKVLFFQQEMTAGVEEEEEEEEEEKKREGYASLLHQTLKSRRGTYDLIAHDMYAGANPTRLLSLRVFRQLRDEWLSPDGVLLVNFIGYDTPERGGADARAAFPLTAAVVATLRQLFPFVRCFTEVPLDMAGDSCTNILCLATSAKEWQLRIPEQGDYANPPEGSTFWIVKNFQNWEIPLTRSGVGNGSEVEGEDEAPIHESDAEDRFAAANVVITRHMRQLVYGILPEATAAVDGTASAMDNSSSSSSSGNRRGGILHGDL